MAKRPGKDYFGWGKVVSVILAIIPITAWILGILTKCSRLAKGKLWSIVCIIIRVIFGFSIIWLLDLIGILFWNRIFAYL